MASTAFEPNPGNHQPAEEAEQGLDVLGFLRRRKSFILLLAAVGVGIGYLMFQRQVPQYRSDAWVQVIHRNNDPRLKTMLSEKDLSDADYVIRSPKILKAAYEKHNLAQLASLRGLSVDEAVAQLVSMISTKAMSSAVVQINCTGRDPADIRDIANAVAEEYLELQRENYEDASTELQALLTRARDEIHESLKKAELAYGEFRKSSRLMTDGGNPHRSREQAIQAEISSIEMQKTKLRSELQSLEAALRTGGSREAILLLVNKETSNTATGQASGEEMTKAVSTAKSMAETMFPLLMQEAVMSAELGADHPKLATLRLQIDLTRKHMKELSGLQARDEKGEKTPQDKPQDFLSVYLQSLSHELQILENQQLALKTQAIQEEELARGLMQEEIEDRNMQNEMNRLSKLFDGTTMQISEIKVNAGMGGVTAQVLAPARHGALVYPKLSQFLGLGAFLGGFVGLAIGYLVEMADRSFRKPEELIREFGVPIMGHVPFMNDQRLKGVSHDAAINKTAVTFHLPRSRPSEAYRSVRTAVSFSPIGGMHKLLQVTSPAAGDGKSTLSLNLAISMAQSGKKTLLMESDFRRPKVHKLTGVDNKNGVVDVLRGTVELEDAIQSTEIPDFFVMSCGTRPKDPSELLSRPQYEQLLQTLREKFDMVIIDTPPVLAVTDPCSVGPRVDGVIICMRLSRHTRELGRRTLDQLREVGANIGGIVINGVEERDAYGYGSYRYSDYRYYYKNYNYKYSDYGSGGLRDDYFTDEDSSDVGNSTSESLKSLS